ncbi:MAG TPA: carboxypeptidase regulatory-like domain-containing protein [Candidatus Angelobacter sp.]|nr:carboxypeptidase regulatory-like domain-containing protein [Candidatus Angelobacter sp.]
MQQLSLRSKSWLVGAFFFLLLINTPALLVSQDATGRIVGTVTDPSGAVIAGARVVVTNADTHVTRATVTNGSGFYQVLALPVGNYTVQAERTGFNPVTTTASKLDINQSLKIDIRLQVGAKAETVTVESNAATVETISPTMGSTVSDSSIQDLPLNGRNVLDLALLQPGVLPADNPNNTSAFSANTAFSISGGRNDSNTFILDGGLNNDLLDNGVVYNPDPDAVQEFKVLTSNFTAEYGRNGGGIVTVVTKSGTNTLHGSAYEFNRNDAYNASDFFSNFNGLPRPVLKRNQFGGTLGGPILKDKLFFFGSYEGQRENSLVPGGQVSVLTPQEAQGDFSASPNQPAVAAFLQANPFFQPDPTKRGVNKGDPTIIDPSTFDPAAKAYLQAGLVPISPSGSASFQNPAKNNFNELTTKFDWNWNDNNHFTTTLGRFHNDQLNPGPGGIPGFNSTTANTRQFLHFAYTRIFSPNMLNEFHVSAQRNDILQSKPANSLPTPSQLGINITPDLPTGPPQLDFSNLTVGFSIQGPSNLTDNTFNYSDTLSWTRGKHTMKFGGAFSAFQDNQLFDFIGNGLFDFGNSNGAGDPFANFLAGLPLDFLQFPAAPSNIRGKSTFVFGQDEWHVTPTLVLTLGLRYEYSTPKLDTLGRTFDVIPGQQSTVFPGAPVGLVFPGDPGAPRGANFPDRNDWAPRFGFAWQPFKDSKTSVRGGIGVFYDILKAEDNFQFNGQVPFASAANFGFPDPSVNGSAGPFNFFDDPFGSTGFPNPFPTRPVDHSVNFFNNFGTFGGGGVFFVDPHLRTPYTYQYNLSIEHEVARRTTLEVAYVGSFSRKLTALKDINPFDPATLNSGNPQRILNETPGNHLADNVNFTTDGSFGLLNEFTNSANASYNALQLSLRKQVSNTPVFGNAFFTLGYTYAHSIDDASGFRQFNSNVSAVLPHVFRASSDFDIRHFLVFSGGWELPFNKGPKALVKGWNLFPILTWRTGYPLTASAGLFSLNSDPGLSGAGDSGLVNADLTGPIHYVDPHQVQNLGGSSGPFFLDPTAFSDNPTGPYGTAPRNVIRAPGRTNLDLALSKTTPIYKERATLELRVDSFNIFNHTQFSNFDTDAADLGSTFGQATQAYAPRILQLAAHIRF